MHRDIAAIQEKIHAESAFVGRLLDEVRGGPYRLDS